MASVTTSVAELCREAKLAARRLAAIDSDTKNAALLAIASALEARVDEVLEANARDLEAGRESGLSAALMDRLRLDASRVRGIADGARAIAALPDPVGEVVARDGNGGPIGKGICNYSAAELRQVMGMQSAAVREVMPQAVEEAVHRDYFVLS